MVFHTDQSSFLPALHPITLLLYFSLTLLTLLLYFSLTVTGEPREKDENAVCAFGWGSVIRSKEISEICVKNWIRASKVGI